MNIINFKNIKDSKLDKTPFNNMIIDNFFDEDFAKSLAKSFPEYKSKFWKGIYNDELVNKKTCHEWSNMPSVYYSAFHQLVSLKFINILKKIFLIKSLEADYGLHGGGLHTYANGGKLNIHLDYYTHYKLPHLRRNINLIIYLTENWHNEYGGQLELWDHDLITNKPKKCIKKIEPIFNRAVIFDTTQNSWHGVPEQVNGPSDYARNSMAIYYLSLNDYKSDRNRALLVPQKDQENNLIILDKIKKYSENY